MVIRLATPADRDFVDETYRSIRFAPSGEGDLVVVADEAGARVGLGRLVPLSGTTARSSFSVELGGIWVAESHRGRGIARAIVSDLLTRTDGKRVFCVPFKPLAPFYRSFGFADAWDDAALPSPLLSKLDFCRATYPTPVVVLVIDPR